MRYRFNEPLARYFEMCHLIREIMEIVSDPSARHTVHAYAAMANDIMLSCFSI
jgi:hypothetical protein